MLCNNIAIMLILYLLHAHNSICGIYPYRLALDHEQFSLTWKLPKKNPGYAPEYKAEIHN